MKERILAITDKYPFMEVKVNQYRTIIQFDRNFYVSISNKGLAFSLSNNNDACFIPTEIFEIITKVKDIYASNT